MGVPRKHDIGMGEGNESVWPSTLALSVLGSLDSEC